MIGGPSEPRDHTIGTERGRSPPWGAAEDSSTLLSAFFDWCSSHNITIISIRLTTPQPDRFARARSQCPISICGLEIESAQDVGHILADLSNRISALLHKQHWQPGFGNPPANSSIIFGLQFEACRLQLRLDEINFPDCK
jgi:hypothetical protein